MAPGFPPLFRALALPFQPASLLLILPAAGLLALFGAFRSQVSVPAWLGTYVLCVWINRYAFALLDAAANGEPDAPVASVEMLGPFSDARSWVLPALTSLCALAVWLAPAAAQLPLLGAAALLLPLPVAATELSDRLVDALNPLAWWRVLHGLGVLYLALLGLVAGLGAMGWMLWRAPLWSGLQFAGIALLYLMAFTLLGGLMFARRTALQFIPRRSPERVQERLENERALALQRLIDGCYTAVRARRSGDLAAQLRAWFASAALPAQHADALHLCEAARQWGDAPGLRLLRTTLISTLAQTNPAVSLQVAQLALQEGSAVPLPAPVASLLIRHARQTGQRRLAATLLTQAMSTASPEDLAALRALQDEPSA